MSQMWTWTLNNIQYLHDMKIGKNKDLEDT